MVRGQVSQLLQENLPRSMDGSTLSVPSSSAIPAPRTGVLIATDVKSDGKLLQRQLDGGFGKVVLCQECESAGSDFEKHRPRVLLLAFNALSKVRNYSLSLYRRSALTHDLPHRTLILCSKDEAAEAFSLCEKGIYDDYVLYWPLSQDGQRLRMSVLLAMRYLDIAERSSSTAQIARQARQIAALERMVVQAKDQFDAGMSTVEASQPIPRSELSAALEALNRPGF